MIGEELSNIRMGRNGEIHNNENARIKLGGKVYIGGTDDGSISLIRNYAASIAITGKELILNSDRVENIAKEGNINRDSYLFLV